MAKPIRIWTMMPDIEIRGALPKIRMNADNVVDVDADQIATNLESFLGRIQDILNKQPETISGYVIDEIEVNLSVNASGGIELIGKLEAGVQSSLRIKLKRIQ